MPFCRCYIPLMQWSLVYLHGVGQGVHTDGWYEALRDSLGVEGVDLPAFGSPRIVVPTYVNLLTNPPHDAVREPDRSVRPKGTSGTAARLRGEFARRQALIVQDLPGSTDSRGLRGVGSGLGPGPAAYVIPKLQDAEEYVTNENLRFAIVHEVIKEIGTRRDLIVVGHSLGSMVALDLIAHLPRKIRIRRLVTVGSPLGALGMFRHHPEALLGKFPYTQVESWVNLFSPSDLVTRGLGVSKLFPAATDVPLRMTPLVHNVATYLAHPAVARVIARAMEPQRRPEVIGSALAVALDGHEQELMDAVRFGALVGSRLQGERRERFQLAHQVVARETMSRLLQGRRRDGRPVPTELLQWLRGDTIDTTRFATRDPREQLLFAILAATTNPIAPYDVDDEKEQLDAIADLWTVGFGNSAQNAATVISSIRQATDAWGSGAWRKLLIGAVGLALVVAAPVGLAVAAPAGLAGGAAIVSALAAFGPGGMIGGLAMAGSLVMAGSGLAVGAVTPAAMSADMMRTQATRLMAYALAHRDLDLPGDRHQPWITLSTWYSELASEQNLLAPLSDKGTPKLKEIDGKLGIVSRALRWMAERSLALELPKGSGRNV